MEIAYLPPNLELEKLLENCPPAFNYHPDDFRFIIGTLIMMRTLYKDYQKMEFIPLSSEILQKKVRNYNKCLTYLVDNGIVEVDKNGWYTIGKKSRQYKLADQYVQHRFVPVKITKASLIKRSGTQIADRVSLERNYKYLTKWFNEDLQIDLDGAADKLEELFNAEKELDLHRALETFSCRFMSAEMLANGIYRLSVDPTGKRFHSNITFMKSELRKFITYEGRSLVSVDIKNSQPFFSMVLFNRDFYLKEKDRFTLYRLSPQIFERIKPVIPDILYILSDVLSIMLVKSDESEASTELELYCTLVDKGRLYNHLSDVYYEKTGFRYDINDANDKQELKTGVFYTLYSKNNSYYGEYSELKALFKSEFPSVYKIFSLLKNDKHNDLAIILQLIESEIVIRNTAKALSKRMPKLPIFTVHDNIATVAGQDFEIYRELKEQCYSAIGLMPSLDVQEWN